MPATSSGSMTGNGTWDRSTPARAWNSVSTRPGQQTWTCTPVPASSPASACVKATWNAFAPAYTARLGSGRGGRELLNASTDATLMIVPDPRATIAGTAARASRLTARTCTAARSDTTCGSTLAKSPYPANPAVLTSMSGPAAAMTCSSPATSPGWVRSAT